MYKRQAGATEVHLRISAPEVTWPCFYGIDTPSQDELMAATMSNEQMREFIGCDSLAFISVEGLRASVQSEHRTFCEACFTGRYVVELPDYLKKTSFLAKEQ